VIRCINTHLQANNSNANLNHINVTTHNGAANLFVSGGGRLRLDNAWLYSSGPAAGAVVAAGNGSVVATRVRAFTGGRGSAVFASHEPNGALNITSAVAKTVGAGSPCFAGDGQIFADAVHCETTAAPFLAMDGAGFAKLYGSSGIAGRLAGVAAYSSGARRDGAVIDLDTVELSVSGDMPALWFGNTVATAFLEFAELSAPSRLLVVANRSTVTPDFTPTATNATRPAVVSLTVSNSRLVGDIVAMGGSEINLTLREGSTLVGSVYTDGGNSTVNVRITGTARWQMTNRASEVNELFIEDRSASIVTNGNKLHVVKDLS
jgi:hypothetical protein